MNTSSIRSLSAVAPIALSSLLFLQPVEAATTKYVMTKKTITLNSKLISSPVSFTAGNTAYMPAYYLMRALDGLGVKSTWNGKDWRLTVPSSMPVDLKNLNIGTGSIAIYINNTLVKKINGIATPDPASGVTSMYLPAWYAMTAVFNRLGIVSTWDGTHWDMKKNLTPPTPSGPPDDTPQASTIPGAVDKSTLVRDMMSALGAPLQAPSASNFDDMLVTDSDWAYVGTASQAKWITPFSSSHFGAGDVVTLADAEQFYWNYLNISQAQYQPGQSLEAWSTFLGLEQGVAQTQYLLQSDEQRFIDNLKPLVRGYVQSGANYAVRYTPKDEYAWTFAGATSSSGTPYFSDPTDIQDTLNRTYGFFNGISVSLQGDSLLVTAPLSSDGQWFAYGTTADNIQYSLDNGVTWTTTSTFDETTLTNRPASVVLKVGQLNGLRISYNRMMPQYGGSVALGVESISYDPAAGLQVKRLPLQ